MFFSKKWYYCRVELVAMLDDGPGWGTIPAISPSSRSLQSSMGSGNNHNIFTVTPAVIRHSSCPVSPVSFLVIFTFFFLRPIMHSGHVLTVLRHVSVLPASPTLRSFLSFFLVLQHLYLLLSVGRVKRVQFSASLCLSFQRGAMFLFLCLSWFFFYPYFLSSVGPCRSSSVHNW